MKRLALALLITSLPLAFAAAAIAQEGGPDTPGEASAPASTGTGEPEEAAVASIDRGRKEVRSCRVIAKQIAHFGDVKVRAKERGNTAWEQGTERHLDGLRMLQLQRCPDDVPPSMVARLTDLLIKSGRIAAAVATFGAF